MGDFPLMTEKGTFIYNGAERVIVTQLVRSPGPYYSVETDKSGNKLYSTQIIPGTGAHGWNTETDSNEIISVRVDRTRKTASDDPSASVRHRIRPGNHRDLR